MNNKTLSIAGAGIGLAVFLAVGLLPAMLYGGYAGVMLAGGLFGLPLTAGVMTKLVVVFGMVLGVTATASLFTVAGAALGAAWGVVLEATEAKTQPAKR